jgi:broad specificity phosphatase PhoE
MRLILTRHGQTEENKKRILQGHMQGQLSELGIEQAKKLAKKLSEEKIDCIYSSDLARAVDTAKEIVKFHPEIEIKTSNKLRETDFGEWSGMKYNEIDPDKPPDNLESEGSLQKRVVELLEEIYKEHKYKTVVIVAHFGPLSVAICHYLEIPVKNMKRIRQDNVALNIIEVKEEPVLLKMNSTEHIE